MEDSKPALEIAPERKLDFPEPEKGFFKKLKRGLLMTHTEMLDKISAAVDGRTTIDEETLEILEEALISADLGVETSLELVDRLRRDAGRHGSLTDPLALRERLVDEISVMLGDIPMANARIPGNLVTLVVGVNGVGKTTSIAKLARRAQMEGEKVILAAADTFRAAAIDQLVLWGERLDVPVIRQSPNSDPAAVVYDALQAARARKSTRIFVDTAGRLHNKDNLMAELGKINRVIEREASDWYRRTLLVLDATTGQNALAQARRFTEIAEVDAVLLSKLDGTAKGGMAVAVAKELGLPVLYLGVGEAPEDLVEFRPREFAAALLG